MRNQLTGRSSAVDRPRPVMGYMICGFVMHASMTFHMARVYEVYVLGHVCNPPGLFRDSTAIE
jgi:hypothetical protein